MAKECENLSLPLISVYVVPVRVWRGRGRRIPSTSHPRAHPRPPPHGSARSTAEGTPPPRTPCLVLVKWRGRGELGEELGEEEGRRGGKGPCEAKAEAEAKGGGPRTEVCLRDGREGHEVDAVLQ